MLWQVLCMAPGAHVACHMRRCSAAPLDLCSNCILDGPVPNQSCLDDALSGHEETSCTCDFHLLQARVS